MTVGINTEAINNKNIPFTMYDLGWVVLCIGAAIGSGIVFFPLQVGLKGVWVFALAVILGYPAVYYMQKLFIETMARSDEQDSYLSIITSYVGSRWGVLLGALYSFTMLKSMVEYALAITNDSASYLKTFGLTNQTLSEHWWWSLLLIAGLSLVASKGEKLLFKVSGSMIAVKLVIIVAIGFVVIPFWDLSNIGAFPTVSHLVVGTFPTLPFAIFSIMFVGILNPMNIAYKKREEDKDVAKYKILRVHKVAYLVLVATVLLFVMSIVLSISEADALRAYQDNISALALAAKVIPGAAVKYMSVVLNVFSIVTAFLALYLAVHESFVGLIKVTVEKMVKPQANNSKAISVAAFVMVVLVLWLIVLTNFPILKVFVFGGVTYGLISCIIPGFIILKNDKFSDLRGVSVYYVILIGMLMCIGPFVMLFSQ
ncbi:MULTISPECIES: amino acid permease [Klebsiella]|uniref:Amino acid permease n=2 Tax=Klebsiella quasipneumoniae TaxID=1463165 RepID=A0AAW8XY64_9ENTR|nr:amino acid permease [Klebsiella quasipneumoniae]EKU0049572.1 transporter [Klebsiella quasipneumoniae]EKU3501363.1 transporter [Klebsiella quasipneumoniae]EKU3506411.1 transporter [Klebsiella quasipneumoniae]EKU3511933.1 transporter [Klebsiella quasipneumoniae]EKU3528295.1 transporter [Klebsiella quasipneumoniae]